MPNEELIYRITRAIYDRLGAGADENTVEQLVTDIYREVEPQLRNGSPLRRHSLLPASRGNLPTRVDPLSG